MTRRIQTLVGIITAFAIMFQTVSPTWALAEASVRCANAPMSASPCMRAVVTMSGPTASHVQCADMACCRNKSSVMRACSLAQPTAYVPGSRSAFQTMRSLEPVRCIITIRALGSSQPALSQKSTHAFSASVPAITTASPSVLAQWTTNPLQRVRANFPPSVITHQIDSHGLRAPPVF